MCYLIRYLDACTDSTLWLIPTNIVSRDKLLTFAKMSQPRKMERNTDLAAFCYCLESSDKLKKELEDWYFENLGYNTDEYKSLKEHWQTIISQSKLVIKNKPDAHIKEIFDIQISW